MSIHKRIKDRRIAMGFESHRALAEALGLSWQTIQQWEKEGGTAPKRQRIDEVAKVLGVSSEWLMTGAGNLHTSQDRPAYKVSESPAPIPITINSDREAEKLLTPPPEGFNDLALLKDAIKGAHTANEWGNENWSLDQIAMLATFFYNKWKIDGVMTIPTKEECELALKAA